MYPIIRRRGYLSPKKGPVISLVGDLEIIFEILDKDNKKTLVRYDMLEENVDVLELYHQACEKLVKEVEFVVANTLFGGFAILADKAHESSSLCFQSIWTTCADKLEDDLLIMVPTTDIVIFAPKAQEEVVEKMIIQGKSNYLEASNKVSPAVFIFTREEKELKSYEPETAN
ncbi:MAG TPA: hypothetical protein H9887_08985 [Candidatus Dorea intestinavium]|nr:hypothetical protein [Candidatus Dorea intestinavium]